MKYVSWMIAVCVFASAAPENLDAGQRIMKHYRIAENAANLVDQSPYILTLTSANLDKYPRSVVTFTVSTEPGRSISSIAPGAAAPERLSAKRHYTMMTDDQFGHAGTPQVIFNREVGTVFIGFVGGKDGRKYFYKELSSVTPEVAQHRMPPPGIPDSQ